MSTSSAEVPARATAIVGAPFPVLANPAKLRPPLARHDVVAHARLLGLRPTGDRASVVMVLAPAGYGKTTLLSEWVAHDERPVLWVSLDRHDDDPTTLVTHVAQAVLNQAGSRRSAPMRALKAAMETPAASIWSILMPRLSVALQALAPFTLVFDDLQTISSAVSRDVIEWLTLHVPDGAQVVLAGRSESISGAARLRVGGELVALSAKDLALTDAEAHSLLGTIGLRVTADEASRLNRDCEGWVSGLLMTAPATPGASPLADAAAPRPQEDLVRDYLQREVLSPLTREDREFLLRSSVLRAASGPLCDAVLERTGSQRMLEHLCDANAFVTRLGDGWCSLHDLLRLALLEQLQAEEPGLVAELRGRAAEWHALHGDPAEAVHYSMESGVDEQTVSLIGGLALVEYGLGRQATIDGWLDWLESTGHVGQDPLLALLGSMVSGLAGDPERSERLGSSVRAAGGDDPAPVGSPEMEGYAALLAAWQCRRGAAAMLADASRACELLSPESPWWKSALGALAIAQMMDGQDDSSDEIFTRMADEGGASTTDTNARSLSRVFLARRALLDHDLDTAQRRLDESAAIRVANGITEQGLQALEDAVAARLALVIGHDAEEARRRLAHAQTVRPLTTWAIPGLALPIRLELVRAHLALADLAGTRVLIREAFDILHHRPGLGALEAEARQLCDQVSQQTESASGPLSLTTAELRLVPWLATHLSFREIGERLFLSTNTVKTEALSTYRKLGVSSRSDAVEAAVGAGLLDPASLPGILFSKAERPTE